MSDRGMGTDGLTECMRPRMDADKHGFPEGDSAQMAPISQMERNGFFQPRTKRNTRKIRQGNDRQWNGTGIQIPKFEFEPVGLGTQGKIALTSPYPLPSLPPSPGLR